MRLNSIQEEVLHQLENYLPNSTIELVELGDSGGELIALQRGDQRLLLASYIPIDQLWREMIRREIRLGVVYGDFSDRKAGSILQEQDLQLLLVNQNQLKDLLQCPNGSTLKDWILGELYK